MPEPLTNMSDENVRSDVALWLKENWNPARPKAEWQALVIDAGWAAPTWTEPTFGRSATGTQAKTSFI